MAGIGKLAKFGETLSKFGKKVTRPIKRPVKKFMCEKVFGKEKTFTRKVKTTDANGNTIFTKETYTAKVPTQQSYQYYKYTRNGAGIALGTGLGGWGAYELLKDDNETDVSDTTYIPETDTTPADSTATAPADSTATVPVAPADSTATAPADSTATVPVAPADSTATAPADSTATVPVAPADSTATAPADSTATVPVAPADSTDTTPAQPAAPANPTTPVQQTPPANNLFGGTLNEISIKEYNVVKGDCLWNIAKHELQKANPNKTITNGHILQQVKEFIRLNPQIKNPDLIYPEQKIKTAA